MEPYAFVPVHPRPDVSATRIGLFPGVRVRKSLSGSERQNAWRHSDVKAALDIYGSVLTADFLGAFKVHLGLSFTRRKMQPLTSHYLSLRIQGPAAGIARGLQYSNAEVFQSQKEANNPRDLIGQPVAKLQNFAMWHLTNQISGRRQ